MDDSRELIELVNKLQKHFKSTGCGPRKIELPQIVVVGAQSSGKSSVLDGLVGFSILPRGSGTVTKCPIIVQLITITDDEKEGIELEDFPEDGRSDDYDQVRAKIGELMERNDGAITDTPIIVQVYSPKVVTLTVVDLPGIKRLTSTGEPSDLEQLIFALSRKYIQQKNAIILAVSPANYYICNSDGLLLAKEADPEGHRTIGVLTKLDLMDEGTNARDLLTGISKEVQLKLGMIGLVNRSQKDIDNNWTVEQQMKKEARFLSEHYPDLVDHSGVPYLRKRLHKLLVQHILKCLPEVLEQLEDLLLQCNNRLAKIPDVSTHEDQFAFVSKVIQRFENDMKKEIEGSPRTPEYRHLCGGIVIKDIFANRFSEDMDTAEETSDNSISNSMIMQALRNSGSYDSIFVNPEAVFRKLAQDQIRYIEGPALKCVDRVKEEIINITDRNLDDQNNNAFKYFPELRKLLKSVITSMLDENLDTVKSQVKDYIGVQSCVIFSLDSSFVQKISDLRWHLEKQLYAGDSNSEKDELNPNPSNGVNRDVFRFKVNELLSSAPTSSSDTTDGDKWLDKLKNPACISLIKDMVKLYFRLIKSQVQDFVPKLIAARLIIPISDEDGCLGVKLKLRVLKKYESLTQLPWDVKISREKEMQFKEHLKEVVVEVKKMLDTFDYERSHEIRESGDAGFLDG